MDVPRNEEWVRVLLAAGALCALLGAGLQAKAEIVQYKDLVDEAKLSDDEAAKLIGEYFSVSYFTKFILWSVIPIYGPWIIYIREPRKLIDKLVKSALPESKTNRAKEAIVKARNWLIILAGALFVLAAGIWDALIGIKALG